MTPEEKRQARVIKRELELFIFIDGIKHRKCRECGEVFPSDNRRVKFCQKCLKAHQDFWRSDRKVEISAFKSGRIETKIEHFREREMKVEIKPDTWTPITESVFRHRQIGWLVDR